MKIFIIIWVAIATVLFAYVYRENSQLRTKLMEEHAIGDEVIDRLGEVELKVGKLPPTSYYEMPNLIVNIKADGGEQRYARLKTSADLHDGQQAAFFKEVPKINDRFNAILIQKNISYFKEPDRIALLKNELLQAAEDVVGKGIVKEILIQEILIQ